MTSSRLRITYRGKIVLALDNYDVVLSRGAATFFSEFDGPSAEGQTPQVIFKGSTGVRYDGGEYFRHPEYPIKYASRYWYANRVIAGGDEHYPPFAEEPSAPLATTRERYMAAGPRQAQRMLVAGESAEQLSTTERLDLPPFPPPTPPSSEQLSQLYRLAPYAVQCRPVSPTGGTTCWLPSAPDEMPTTVPPSWPPKPAAGRSQPPPVVPPVERQPFEYPGLPDKAPSQDSTPRPRAEEEEYEYDYDGSPPFTFSQPKVGSSPMAGDSHYGVSAVPYSLRSEVGRVPGPRDTDYAPRIAKSDNRAPLVKLAQLYDRLLNVSKPSITR